jgi:hypothetical protein
LVLAVSVFSASVVSACRRLPAAKGTGNNPGGRPEAAVSIDGATVQVEVADEPEERQRGLSGRERLGEDEGMFFVFQTPGRPSFWMKGMKFPLDFIWVYRDRVAEVTESVPPPSPGTPDRSLSLITPTTPVTAVLEVNAGYVAKHDLAVGDEVRLRRN